MNYTIRLSKNSHGDYDIIVNFRINETEFSMDFFSSNIIKTQDKLIDTIKKYSKNVKISTIRLMIAGTLMVTIPFSTFIKVHAAQKFSMSYLYSGTATQQISYVNRTKNSLDTVSPSYFDIKSDGTIKVNSISKDLISSMHDSGVKVVPFLSNHWNQEAGIHFLNNIEARTTELANLVSTYNLDGINVDIENVTHTQRDLYTQFVAALRAKIPSNKEVSVAVAANPKGWSTGWQGSYDYQNLAKHADYLLIMTYDEHYQGSLPGPVASAGFVEDSIKYALKYTTGGKIVIGLPFYGRIWSEDNNFNGQGVPLNQIDAIIETYNAAVTYDTTYKSPKAEFTVKSGGPTTTINGKTLTPGKYTIWYENDKSLQAKLALVQTYNLKGAGSWALGNEPESLWTNYSIWLNGSSTASTAATATTAVPVAAKPVTINKVGKAKTSTLNIRSGASSSKKIVTKVKSGTTLWVTKKLSSGWYQVKLSNGKTGYAYGKYISLLSTQTTTAKVNIRKKTSATSKKLGTISKGKKVKVLSLSGKYTKVSYGGKTGFVLTKYLK